MRIGDKVKATIPGHTAGIVTVTVTIQHSGLHRMVAITVAVLTLGTPTAVAAAEHPSQGRSTTATGHIQATAEHPIHVTTPTGDGHWVNAADLHPGQQLTSSDPTHTITVTRVDSYTKGLTAYNLTTTPQHTYYINPDRAPPATNVLVHNAAACSINPGAIRFSQSSVNGVDEIAASMRANGWVGKPIDVVRMPDGGLTAIDNTRVLAAHQAGNDVQATIRGFDEALPEGMIPRFTTPKGGSPSTWGEALLNRVGAQNSGFRSTYPFGSPFTGWGGG